MPKSLKRAAIASILAAGFSVVTLSTAHAESTNAAPHDPRQSILHDVDHPSGFDPHYTNQKQWEQRARQLREQILVAEGLWPMPRKTPLNAVVHGKIERDGYTIEDVSFASMPGHYVTGNLYVPTGKSGPFPGVLCPHGHWPGGRFYENTEAAAKKQIEIGAEQTMVGARFPIQARCAMLARMGCIVFQYDMVGYADSTAIEHRAGFTDAQAILRLQSFMGLQTWNSIRTLDFVLSLPDVDPKRIAVTGASGGGTQTMILDAIDDRPAVDFPAVMVSDEMQGGCICENAPLLRIGTNNLEIAAAFAPRPMGMSSANDWTRHLVERGLPKIKAIYQLYGAGDQTMAWYRSFEHNYNQVSRELMYNWMNDHLKLGWASPVKEVPFKPVPPKELSVYDAKHPRPSDELGAEELRKRMTAASDAQMAQLRSNPDEYRKVVGTALRVMVGNNLPSAGDVSLEKSPQNRIAGFATLETGLLVRQSTGVALPYYLLKHGNTVGQITIVVDDPGRSAVLTSGGLNDISGRLISAGQTVLCADLALTGQLSSSHPPDPRGRYANYDYAGYYFGYNPSLLGERVNDLLAEVAAARSLSGKPVNIIGLHHCGVVALVATALAGDSVNRAVIDLNEFDFDQVKDVTNEMMLPGALKYGGVGGFAEVCAPGRIAVGNVPRSGANLPRDVKRLEEPMLPSMIRWIRSGAR
ncbi:MAG TPA: alpha/beta hydrolase family protein [Tepidisphaeraceae bacterium]|nr:alpha/beta hydrolase family protein [Tepidisphaeraceae bacterium]